MKGDGSVQTSYETGRRIGRADGRLSGHSEAPFILNDHQIVNRTAQAKPS